MGTNELLENRASLFNEFDDICTLLINSVKGYLEEKNILTEKISDYLVDLRKFLLMRKKDPFKNLDSVKSESFNYDFEAIRKSGYNIDPNTLTKFSKPFDYEFFHNKKQKKHITNQINMYSQSAIGFAKMLQQSNLQLLFRTFSKTGGKQISN